MEINHSFVVDVEPGKVWETLWDVDRVARCIPGCEGVTVVEARKAYRAQVKKKVGPFALGMELDVTVIEMTPPDLLRVVVKGEDRRLRSRVIQEISIALTRDGERATRVDIAGQFTLEGLLGALNKHLVSGQVAQTLEEFSGALRAAIFAGSAPASAEAAAAAEAGPGDQR